MAKKREEFSSVYKWNVKDLYKSDDACKKELKNILKDSKELLKFKGHILDDQNSLYNLLELDKNISMRLEAAFTYAHINSDADTTNSKYQELYGLARNVYSAYLESSSYIVPELLKSDYIVIQKYISLNKKLSAYKRNLKEIFRNKKHVLSEDVENVLSILSTTISSFDDIMGTITDSDFKFDSIKVDGKVTELTESNYSVYLRHRDQSVRKQAFTNLFKTYGNYKNTLAIILKNEIDKNVKLAKIRHFNSSLERSLFNDEIDKKVYFNLIESVHKNLSSLYKYWALKKKVLNLKEFHIYDTYAPINTLDNDKYSFEEARDKVLEAVRPLGDEYVKDISSSFKEGWIDSCNNEGKRGGAYCTACYSAHPYVLMSFEGMLNDVSTLAHELGHAMHYYYACKYQNYQDYGYSIFVAEVASQVNEILLCRYLLDNSDSNNMKLNIIDDLLQKYKSTIFRQTMFAEFELYLNEYTAKGGILTSDNMCNKYLELNKVYFGDNVIIDDDIKYEWERIPHFYMNYYVWMYATGFAAAVKLANDIYDGNVETRDKYLKFLRLGSTKNPINSLKVAGVDMTKSEVMDDAIKFMNKLIREYEKLQDVKGSEIDE